ncbi:hypothetical protein J6590_050623 [Homalodisca vitripennis]|nr:hypothetical protein J6590_050623 [Homalodisca vitripennis]
MFPTPTQPSFSSLASSSHCPHRHPPNINSLTAGTGDSGCLCSPTPTQPSFSSLASSSHCPHRHPPNINSLPAGLVILAVYVPPPQHNPASRLWPEVLTAFTDTHPILIPCLSHCSSHCPHQHHPILAPCLPVLVILAVYVPPPQHNPASRLWLAAHTALTDTHPILAPCLPVLVILAVYVPPPQHNPTSRLWPEVLTAFTNTHPILIP